MKFSIRGFALIERPIWFWQREEYRNSGWHVRTGLLRPVAAAFFEARHVIPEVQDSLDRGCSPLVAGLDGDVARDSEASGLRRRALPDFLRSLKPIRPIDNLPQGLVGEDVKPVEHSKGKLSLNEVLELRGHEPIRHPHTPEYLASQARLKARIAGIEAQRPAEREPGAAA